MHTQRTYLPPVRRAALLAALAAVASATAGAQTVYLRTPGTGVCRVIGASNTNPVRITVANASVCGINQNGQIILVTEVRGNTAANIHLENATDTANLARKVANLSGNSFDLLNLGDNPVAGNGAYVNGGRVGLASAYTLRQHPRIYLDGPDGSIRASVSNTGANGRASASNVAFTALKNAVTGHIAGGSDWGRDRSGNRTAAAAMRWLADGDAAARAYALSGLQNITQVLGTPACDESQRGCGAPGSSVQDYPTQYMENFAQAYSILRDEMTVNDRTNFLNFVLNDLPWTQGGFDYTGVSRVKPAWKVNNVNTSGTVAVSGNTVTGTGTSFLANVAVGDIIVIPHASQDVYAYGAIVTAVNSDTSLTVNLPTGTSGSYMVGPAWNNTMHGLSWFSKHYDAAVLCGGAMWVDNVVATCEANYGLQAGLSQSGSGNLQLSRAQGFYAIGLATCGDDPRGCLVLELANEWFADLAVPRALTVWTGISQSTPGYTNWRVYYPVASFDVASRNSFLQAPNYLASTDVHEKVALNGVNNNIVSLGILTPVSEPVTYYLTSEQFRAPMMASFAVPSSTAARQFRDWLLNRFNNYNESFIRYNQGEYVWWHFLFSDPTISPLAASTSLTLGNTNRARCVAVFGTAVCPENEGRYFAASNQNWNADRSYVAMNGVSYNCLDHCGEDVGAWPLIAKNGKMLLSGDGNAFMGGRAHQGYVEIGGTPNNLRIHPEHAPVYPYWMAGNADYVVSNFNLTQTFKAPVGATGVSRQFMHLKAGAQDYVIDHVRVTTSSATSIRGLQHYHLNDCGSPAASTCIAFDSGTATASNTQAGARLFSKALGIGGNVAIRTHSGNASDGSYPNGLGKSFRWAVCPSSDGSTCSNTNAAEWVVIHKPSTDAGATIPNVVQSMAGVFRVVEIQDPDHPKVVAFTAGGATATAVQFTTTHANSAQYVVSGLQPGAYTVTRTENGNSAPVGVFVAAAGGNTIGFQAAAGAFSINPGPPPLAIVTPSLPDAVLGKPYDAMVTAFSSTTPYTWQMQSGSLCAGLAFSQVVNDAVIAGSAETLESCTFTLEVTNATSTETDSREYTINVVEPGPPLAMVTTWLPAGRAGDQYRGALQASGGTLPLTWTVTSGTLCDGLVLDPATGRLGGTPTQLGVCVFTVRATDLGHEYVERQFFISIGEDVQTPLRITSAQPSYSGAVIRFGRRGLLFDQACSLALRLGGPTGSLLTTLNSANGPSRRVVTASGLPSGQTIHASVNCGAESAEAQFETGFAPSAPRPVKLVFRPPSGAPPVSDLVLYYGNTASLQNSLVASCSGAMCTAIVSTADPLLYWRAVYRDSAAAPVRTSTTQVLAPR